MSPYTAINNVLYRLTANAKLAHQLLHASASAPCSPDGADIFRQQFVAGDSLATLLPIGAHFVYHVVVPGPRTQMQRVHAGGHVAVVTDKQVRRDGPGMPQFPGQAVRQIIDAVHCKPPIAIFQAVALPQPAAVRAIPMRAVLHQAPKVSRCIGIPMGHCQPPVGLSPVDGGVRRISTGADDAYRVATPDTAAQTYKYKANRPIFQKVCLY